VSKKPCKVVRPRYTKGIKKYLCFFVLSIIALEGLVLYFPMLLQRVVQTAERLFWLKQTTGAGNVMPLVWDSLLVLLFITGIFGMSFLMEFASAAYADKYQANIRKALYEKFSRLSNDQIDQIGVARILPTMMTDSKWLKILHQRVVLFFVTFPVAILGSFIMLFTLHWMYALIAFASVPIVFIFFYINVRRMSKVVPPSIQSFDEYFLNIKEGVAGARDIRILGKAEERSAEFEQYVRLQRRQSLAAERATTLSTGFNAILFTLVTIGIVIYGAMKELEPGKMAGIVALNTAIQYINTIWATSHKIIVWFAEYLPRGHYTKKRLDGFYSMPESPRGQGLQQIPTYQQHHLKFNNVSYRHANGRVELEDVTFEVSDGMAVAVAGGIGSGKSYLSQLLLKYKNPTSGNITFNEIQTEQLNDMFWRRNIISFCTAGPKFIPGTIRDNMKLLAPDVTDEQILGAFHDIGADDFVKKFDKFLDFEIMGNINDSTRNVLNVVRAILKPAEVYVFFQCFEHVKHQYIAKMMAKLKKEKKTSLFITYDGSVCKYCDNIYVLSEGRVRAVGTHAELIKSSKHYRNLHSASAGVIVYEEQVQHTREQEDVKEVRLAEVHHE